MKTKKVFSLILALATLLCTVVIPANAAEAETHEHIEIIIENENISEETKAKIITFIQMVEKKKKVLLLTGLLVHSLVIILKALLYQLLHTKLELQHHVA